MEEDGAGLRLLGHVRCDVHGSDDNDADDGVQQWLDQARQQWAARRLDLLAGRAAQQLGRGELAAALASTEALLALDPLLEHGWRRLMRLHHLRGHRTAAVAAFERCERVLRDELSLKPAPETLALLAEVEARSNTAPPRRWPLPPSLLRPPRLVARQVDLTRLSAAWQAGQGFVVVGEAGLGKSRPLAEFAAQWPAVLLVTGADLQPETAADVLATPLMGPADAWQEPLAAQVLNDSGFVHESLLDAVLPGLPRALQRPLHERVAYSLRPLGAPAAARARHFAAAGLWAAAADSAVQAATDARRLGRNAEQLTHLHEAAAAHDAAGQPAAAFDARVAALAPRLAAPGLQATLDEAAALQSQACSPAQRVALHLACAEAAVGDCRAEVVLPAAAAALAEAVPGSHEELRSRLLQAAGQALLATAPKRCRRWKACAHASREPPTRCRPPPCGAIARGWSTPPGAWPPACRRCRSSSAWPRLRATRRWRCKRGPA